MKSPQSCDIIFGQVVLALLVQFEICGYLCLAACFKLVFSRNAVASILLYKGAH